MAVPRVSVVCIFLNEERFLAEAVEGVLAQEFDDFELLLIDDGSTDRSPAIAREYAARLPDKVFYLQHPGNANRGMAASRNLGLRHARGEFVAFLDGDDRWLPRKLADHVAEFDAHPAVGLVCGGYNQWRSWAGGKDRAYLSGPVADRPLFAPETTLRVYPLGWSNSAQDIMVRRGVAERVGGFEEHFAGQEERFAGYFDDQVFLAKVYLETGAVFQSRPSIDYRQHPDSCTARLSWPDYLAVRSRFLDWFEDYIRDREVPDKDRIMKAIRNARRFAGLRNIQFAWRQVRTLWLHAIRLAGFTDRFRRHSLAN